MTVTSSTWPLSRDAVPVIVGVVSLVFSVLMVGVADAAVKIISSLVDVSFVVVTPLLTDAVTA